MAQLGPDSSSATNFTADQRPKIDKTFGYVTATTPSLTAAGARRRPRRQPGDWAAAAPAAPYTPDEPWRDAAAQPRRTAQDAGRLRAATSRSASTPSRQTRSRRAGTRTSSWAASATRAAARLSATKMGAWDMADRKRIISIPPAVGPGSENSSFADGTNRLVGHRIVRQLAGVQHGGAETSSAAPRVFVSTLRMKRVGDGGQQTARRRSLVRVRPSHGTWPSTVATAARQHQRRAVRPDQAAPSRTAPSSARSRSCRRRSPPAGSSPIELETPLYGNDLAYYARVTLVFNNTERPPSRRGSRTRRWSRSSGPGRRRRLRGRQQCFRHPAGAPSGRRSRSASGATAV